MGLSHPFVGGCSEINDGVTDTAQMSAPNYACYPKGAQKPNSCPNRPRNQVIGRHSECEIKQRLHLKQWLPDCAF